MHEIKKCSYAVQARRKNNNRELRSNVVFRNIFLYFLTFLLFDVAYSENEKNKISCSRCSLLNTRVNKLLMCVVIRKICNFFLAFSIEILSFFWCLLQFSLSVAYFHVWKWIKVNCYNKCGVTIKFNLKTTIFLFSVCEFCIWIMEP